MAALAALLGLSALLVVASPGRANASVSWSAVNPQLPPDAVPGGGLTLASTACPADGWCVAVGNYLGQTGSTYYAAGLIDSLSGGAWTAAASPLPGNALAGDPQTYLESVACASVGSCVAVGRYLDSSGATQGLVVQLANGVWTPSEVSLPSGAVTSGSAAYAELSAVSCPTSSWCNALGLYTQGSGTEQALVDTDVGGSWSASAAPLPVAATGSQFIALSCPAAGSCVATGTYLVAGNHLGFAESLSAGTWTGTTLPVPPGTSAMASIANNDLAVSCPAVGSCVVAGTTFDGNFEGLLDTLSAGTWTAAAVATPNGQPSADVQLTSVACTDPSTCVATGLNLAGGVEQGVFESLSSGTWTASVAPTPDGTPANADIEVHNIACPTAGTCVADGQSDVTGAVNGLLWNLSAGSWVVTAAPLPADANAGADPLFSPIACPGAGVCLAVGTYVGSGGREGVVETDPSLPATTTTVSVQRGAGTAIVYSASVTGSGTPTGTVAFSAGSSALCTATISNGTASCTGSIPPTRIVLASYSGDAASAASWGTGVSPAVPSAIYDVSGFYQFARINTFFPTIIQVKVVDNTGVGVPGDVVRFVLPTTGASAVPWGSLTVVTNAAGIASAPVLSANNKVGSYFLYASAAGVSNGFGLYVLTNTK